MCVFVSLPTMRCSRAALVSCFPAATRVFSSDRAHHTTVQSSPASYNSPHPRNKKRAPRNCGCLRLHSTQPSATADLSAVPPSPAAPVVRAAPVHEPCQSSQLSLLRGCVASAWPAPAELLEDADEPTAPSWLPSPSRHPSATQASPQQRLVVSAPVAATAARVSRCRLRASNFPEDRLPTLLVNAQMGKWLPLKSWPSYLQISADKRFSRTLKHCAFLAPLPFPFPLAATAA